MNIKRIYPFLIIVLFLCLASGCANQKADPTHCESGKLGEYFPIDVFKYQFNSSSSQDIGKMQLLKNDQIYSSYLYSFNNDLAVSVLIENDSNSVIEVILITGPDEYDKSAMQNIIHACDPNLTNVDCLAIINQLMENSNTQNPDGSLLIKNQILYRLKEVGSYFRLTAETIT